MFACALSCPLASPLGHGLERIVAEMSNSLGPKCVKTGPELCDLRPFSVDAKASGSRALLERIFHAPRGGNQNGMDDYLRVDHAKENRGLPYGMTWAVVYSLGQYRVTSIISVKPNRCLRCDRRTY